MSREQSIYEKVFGRDGQTDPMGNMAHAMEVLTREQWTEGRLTDTYRHLIDTYSRRVNDGHVMDVESMTQLEFEQFMLIEDMKGVLFDHQSSVSNGLVDWPYFEATFQDHGRPVRDGNALLVGAVYPQTTRAFEVFSKTVYGAGRAITVDIAPDIYTPRHTTFVQANALRLPFRDESFDIVHITNLLHKLEDPEGVCGDMAGGMRHLYGEIGRVLRPAGQLVMMESAPDLENDSSEFAQRLAWGQAESRFRDMIQQSGFGKVAVKRLLAYASLDHLFDPACQDVPQSPTIPAHFMVHATKTIAL